ncbi:ABC transporter ATP-binding protein [Aquipuribacter sp. MA13-6]|uniref:ABC transporter ATP-binding protein n=1 Tax=unclassified Aquipuribacter TaxID=2635084 RepID=UPI003EEC23D6
MISLSVSDATSPAVTGATEPFAVRVKDVSVTYRTTFEARPTLRDTLGNFGRRTRRVHEINALRNISFDVPNGTAMGIVGSNGAGKSTLVRTLAGVLTPTTGQIEVRGRISALLALGVGFNANLSGRENVMLGGLAAGLSRKQVNERAEMITEFAELDEFIDLPMRVYSSGMYSRLAFAVSVHMDPDILLIDEALSTGDAHFKAKAAAKMTELMASARAIFLVSHSMASVRELCNRAIWINKGTLMMEGTPDEVITAYTRFVKVGPDAFTMDDL